MDFLIGRLDRIQKKYTTTRFSFNFLQRKNIFGRNQGHSLRRKFISWDIQKNLQKRKTERKFFEEEFRFIFCYKISERNLEQKTGQGSELTASAWDWKTEAQETTLKKITEKKWWETTEKTHTTNTKDKNKEKILRRKLR